MGSWHPQTYFQRNPEDCDPECQYNHFWTSYPLILVPLFLDQWVVSFWRLYCTDRPAMKPSLGRVDCKTTLPIRSFYTLLTVPKDRNHCCCTTRFSILSSRSVVFFLRPDLALLAQRSVCINLRHTIEAVLQLMFICIGIQLTVTSACCMLIIVHLCSAVSSLPHPIIY